MAGIVAATLLGTATCGADAIVHPATAYARVTTWVGSGERGNRDGSAQATTFVMPTGLAFDRQGTLFVADAGAENIRAIDRNGTSRTFAGPDAALSDVVPGGYVDGPVAAARFDGPFGLTFGPDGALYVADSRNRVVRRIANGTVSTFAGIPGERPVVDGPAATATFLQPLGLAFDDLGNLYVADDGIGVRVVDAKTHAVSTLAGTANGHPTGLAFSAAAGARTLFIADNAGLVADDLATATPLRLENVYDLTHQLPQRVEGAAAVGFPFAVAALSPAEAVYTDMRDGSVFYNQVTSVRQIAGAEIADPANYGGGWRDGAGPDVRFNVPMGVAAAPDGRIAVADTGNRVLRLVDGIDRRYFVSPSLQNFAAYRPGPHDYGVALVGPSIIWNDSVWDDSIAGVAQSALAASPRWSAAQLGRPVVIPFTLVGASTGARNDFIEDTIADLPVRCVVDVVDLLSIENFHEYGIPQFSAVVETGPHAGDVNRDLLASYVAALRPLRRALASRRIPLIVVFAPQPPDVSPVATPTYQLLVRYPYNNRIAGLRRAAAALGDMLAADGPFYSAAPAFDAAEAAAHPLPLFGTTDRHPSPAGRELLGQAVASALEANADTLSGHPAPAR